MNFIERFIYVINRNNLFTRKDNLVVAVSGGVDSVVLCELLYQSGYKFQIAHCNFQLRREESERDETFVRQLATKYGVEVSVKKFDTESYASENKLSIQEAARKLRYDWFAELVKLSETSFPPLTSSLSQLATPSVAEGLPKAMCHSLLLTAHHADDNNETLLMNFFRGTGLHGLTGIPMSTDWIRRPLLPFTKEELQSFAKENSLKYVEDSSNQSSKYTRNFFRNELMPQIERVYPQVKKNLADNIYRFTETEKLYNVAVGRILKKLGKPKGEELHVPIKQLMSFQNDAVIYELIRPFGFSEKQIQEVVKLSTAESGKFIQSPKNNFRIIRHRHWFIITPVLPTQSENIIIESSPADVKFSLGHLVLSTTSNLKPQTLNNIALLDANHISFPLLLRKPRTSDYFYPLGMKKKKKLQRFFIDQKLSKTEKEKVWVIESAQRIIWVVGHRIDERCKITEKTKECLKIELTAE